MALFKGLISGPRSQVSRLGSKKSGMFVQCNTWQCGISVEAAYSNDQILFTIYHTGGSLGQPKKNKLAIVIHFPDSGDKETDEIFIFPNGKGDCNKDGE